MTLRAVKILVKRLQQLKSIHEFNKMYSTLHSFRRQSPVDKFDEHQEVCEEIEKYMNMFINKRMKRNQRGMSI